MIAERESGLFRPIATEQRLDWALVDEPSERERALVRRYLCALERSDADELVAVMREREAESNKQRKYRRGCP